jgi:hypothetical protein
MHRHRLRPLLLALVLLVGGLTLSGCETVGNTFKDLGDSLERVFD